MKPLLNSKAVCELLSVSPATLSRMVKSGRIPYVLLGTGRLKKTVRFKEDELEAWVQRRTRGAGGQVRGMRNATQVVTGNNREPQGTEIKGGIPVQQTG